MDLISPIILIHHTPTTPSSLYCSFSCILVKTFCFRKECLTTFLCGVYTFPKISINNLIFCPQLRCLLFPSQTLNFHRFQRYVLRLLGMSHANRTFYVINLSIEMCFLLVKCKFRSSTRYTFEGWSYKAEHALFIGFYQNNSLNSKPQRFKFNTNI